MEVKVDWDGTQEGIDSALALYPDYRVKEEQRHFDGMWLILTDEPWTEPPEPEPPVYTHPKYLRSEGNPSARIAHIQDFLETL